MKTEFNYYKKCIMVLLLLQIFLFFVSYIFDYYNLQIGGGIRIASIVSICSIFFLYVKPKSNTNAS